MMKRFTYHLSLRFAAVCAVLVSAVLFVLSLAAVVVMLSFDTYFDNGTRLRYKLYDISANDAVDEIMHAYIEPLYETGDSGSLLYLMAKYHTGKSSVAFSVRTENDEVLFESVQKGAVLYSFSEQRAILDAKANRTFTLYIEGTVRKSTTATDKLYYLTILADYIIARRYRTVIVCVISLGVLAALIFYLLCVAGHRSGYTEPRLAPLDRIPLDLFALILFGIGYMIARAFYFAYVLLGRGNSLITLIVFGAFVMLVALLLLGLILSFAARAKCGDWWKNTLLYKLFGLLGKGIRTLYAGMKLRTKAALIYLIVTLFELGIIIAVGSTLLGILFAFERVVVLVLFCCGILDVSDTEKRLERIAHGDISHTTPLKTRLTIFSGTANNVNSVGEGLKTAVEERTKADRLRTELITNVSHDLKTPLTSIISYVDLMKKEQIASETAREYLDVIDKQSLRLKKLTADLIEASKAASGNITATFTELDAAMLLAQVIAEYEDKLAAVPLEAVTHILTQNTHILADTELLWRVFDNLLGNAVKYAMPDTRLYAELKDDGDWLLITLSNISREPLGMTAEELLERFARADASRHTEGNGLGLSISQSLTEIQQGTLTLRVDGDLFKVELRFNKAENGGEKEGA